MFQGICSRSSRVRIRSRKKRIVDTRMMALLLRGSRAGKKERAIMTATVASTITTARTSSRVTGPRREWSSRARSRRPGIVLRSGGKTTMQ